MSGQQTQSSALFDGTASYYAQSRPPYAPAAIARLMARFGLAPGTTAIDLGCGTGQIALPLSRSGVTVVAVDPNPDMLAEGLHAQHRDGGGDVRWLLDDDSGLSPARFPGVRVCVMGASFHWTDRERLLDVLDAMLEPDGGVALLSGSASIFSKNDSVQGAWVAVAREVVQEFLGPRRRAGSGTYSHPKKSHEDVLAASAFTSIEQHGFTATRTMSVADVVGLQLSTSYASPALLGDRLADFRDTLAARLTDVEPTGLFTTTECTELITAKRARRAP